MKDKIIRLLAHMMLACGLLRKMVVVRMDGGICSQMHFYLIGQYFSERGYDVRYDLGWFNSCGKDLSGRFARNFDLLRAFPHLDVPVANRCELSLYRRLSYTEFTFQTASPPAYLGDYYGDCPNMYVEMFRRYFHIAVRVLDEASSKLYSDIQSKRVPVAIHVRRGDLSEFNGAYGPPVTTAFFAKAMEYISKIEPETYYYLFSDEPQWVRDNLIEKLPFEKNFHVVDVNGADKGYMDLFLIAACKHQICSKGSLGKYGGFLNNVPDGRILVCDDAVERKNWEGRHPKIVFIS